MASLRIHHPVPDFERWKAAFDSDPLDRKGAGVLRYRIYRLHADPNHVMIDLDFATVEQAEAMLVRLEQLWDSGTAPVSTAPDAWVVETVEESEP